MRIFLTGATGYIGSAVLDGFIRAGHQVMALVRTNAGVLPSLHSVGGNVPRLLEEFRGAERRVGR